MKKNVPIVRPQNRDCQEFNCRSDFWKLPK